jgi:hypothetical protein
MGQQIVFEENGRSRRDIPALTGIRAIAALLVLGIHTDLELPANIPTILPFVNRGYLGVDLFFVLSGFIISHVYLDKLRATDDKQSMRLSMAPVHPALSNARHGACRIDRNGRGREAGGYRFQS